MATYPYIPKMDSMFTATGEYSAVAGETTWDLPFEDWTYNTIVLSDDFGDAAGTVLTSFDSHDGEIVVTGDYSAGEVIIGQVYPSTAVLTRPYTRDYRGNALVKDQHAVVKLDVTHTRTWAYAIKAEQANCGDREQAIDLDAEAEIGTQVAWFNGDPSKITYSIHSSSPKPFTVTVVTWLLDILRRAR